MIAILLKFRYIDNLIIADNMFSAINYWYDIDYGPAYGLYRMFDEIARAKE